MYRSTFKCDIHFAVCVHVYGYCQCWCQNIYEVFGSNFKCDIQFAICLYGAFYMWYKLQLLLKVLTRTSLNTSDISIYFVHLMYVITTKY